MLPRPLLWLAISYLHYAGAYQVLISDTDDARQVCSGMWGSGGSREPWIEVVFSPSSRGQLALIIYEWKDAKYIGIDADGTGAGTNEWEEERVYVCTAAAYSANLCTSDQLGQFIVDTPTARSSNTTSIYTTAVRFDTRASAVDAVNGTSLAVNAGPFKYPVRSTGYYCVGAVPVGIANDEDPGSKRQSLPAGTSKGYSTTYTGVVDFENVFDGHLPAADYPKTWFYGILAILYALIGAAWAFLCFKNRGDILPIQHYVSCTIGIILVEMLVLNGYYRYINSSGTANLAQPYLVLVAVVNALRNSSSFFLLLIVCCGYGIVRPSLGAVMTRARILGAVHFIFGVMYSIGIVVIPLDSAGIFIFFCIFPLAFSLSAFMMWIMYALNATIADLENRKQSYKKQMFTRLYRILVGAIMVILAFFVMTSLSFSNRLDDDFAPDTWQSQWWLLDGWLGLLYLLCFASIAYIWRPTSNNQRLAMSDELATDEADAEEFEIDTLRSNRLEAEEGADDKDGPAGYGGVARDDVVFDIGDEDSEDEGSSSGRKHKAKGRNSDVESGNGEEGQRLRASAETDRRSLPPRYSSLGSHQD